MVFSAFAIILSSYGGEDAPENPTSDYKGYLFSSQYDRWTATVNGRQLTMRYSPFELETLYTTLDLAPIIKLLASNKAYLTIIPGERTKTPLQELYSNMKPYYAQLFLACTKDGAGCENSPLKTCKDATTTVGVFILQEGEKVTLEGEGTCYTLTGAEEDLIKIMDKLLLALHGI